MRILFLLLILSLSIQCQPNEKSTGRHSVESVQIHIKPEFVDTEKDTLIGYSFSKQEEMSNHDLMKILMMPSSKSYGPVYPENAGKESPYAKSLLRNETNSKTDEKMFVQVDGTELAFQSAAETARLKVSFPKSATTPCILLDLLPNDLGKPAETYLKIVGNNMLVGFRKSIDPRGDQYLYFAIKFSNPWMVYQFADGIHVIKANEYRGLHTRAVFLFQKQFPVIEVAVGLSSESIDDAKLTLQTD